MTEFQELMLSVCFGGMVGFVVGELFVIIASAVNWVKEKIRKRKERKRSK